MLETELKALNKACTHRQLQRYMENQQNEGVATGILSVYVATDAIRRFWALLQWWQDVPDSSIINEVEDSRVLAGLHSFQAHEKAMQTCQILLPVGKEMIDHHTAECVWIGIYLTLHKTQCLGDLRIRSGVTTNTVRAPDLLSLTHIQSKALLVPPRGCNVH